MSLCKDIYSKSIKQETELKNILNEILTGTHDNCLNRIKEKFNEKLYNFENTISVLEKQILMEYSTNSSNFNIWNKKSENLKLSLNSLPSELNKALNTQSKKLNNKLWSSSYKEDGSNLTYLTSEHDSLKKSLRLSRDIEAQETLLMQELDNQQFSLDSVKNKMMKLFASVDFTNTMTQWLVRRGVSDRQIFFGLVILTCLITFITYYYVKPWLKSFVV